MKKAILTLLVTFTLFLLSPVNVSADFTFTAVGDYASTDDTDSVLEGISNTTASSFNLALGDFSYDQLVPESSWCNYIKSYVGSNFPFELIAGNHEEDGELGHVNNFASCLPDRLGSISGAYSKQYYFDYQNLARFIFISPDLTLDGEYYDYSAGTTRHQWLINTIDSARSSGIKWVIVGMHKYCLNIEDADCPIGESLINTLIDKKVDLVLQGHAHNYERSKQLSINPNCSSITRGIYNGSCVSGNGYSGLYEKSAGTVFLIVGTGGRNLSFIDSNDSEKPYFTSWSGGNTNPTFGFAKISVTDTSLSSEFISTTPGSGYSDSFSIVPSETYNNQQNLVETNSYWKYLDNGSNQGSTWRLPGFDDSTWKNGLSQFGFGDGDEATLTNNNIVTTYFRKTFTVTDPGKVLSLTLNLVRDDGAVVYINGTEVKRTNMPAGNIAYNTVASAYASPPEENYYNTYSLSPNVLVTGENTVAVEIHQATIDSTDMSFNLGLSATSSAPPTPTPTISITPTPTLPATPPISPSVSPTPTPTPVITQENWIIKNSSWKYLDDGSNQGSNWSTLGFDDSSWRSGNAQLGYGDGDEATVIRSRITNYFRKTFNVTDASLVSSLTLDIMRDDGAVVYINGTEVKRTNMPAGAIAYNTLANSFANSPEENYYNTYQIPTSSLINGTNVIAVEIHQGSGSVDVSFNLGLSASVQSYVNPTPTPTVTVTPTPSVSLTPTPGPSMTPTPVPSVTPTPSISPTPTPTLPTKRINAGGASFTDSNGYLWSADTGYNTGESGTVSNTITGTSDQKLYRSERWDRSSAPELTYSFTLPSGSYRVILHFAEIYTGAQAVGKRMFDVSLEGNIVLDNYDIFADVGGFTAVQKQFTVNVTDGTLNILFGHVLENPKVSGIEIIPQ